MSDIHTLSWADPQRKTAFDDWMKGVAPAHGLDPSTVRPASADASFRRYFRVDGARGSRIVMDAPPAHEDCRPFVTVSRLLVGGGLHAPEVLAWDEARGFMLLTDLGGTTYLNELDPAQPWGARNKQLYVDALDALVRIQRIDAQAQVPAYDRALLQRELDLFPEWFVARHHGIVLSDDQRHVLKQAFDLILANTLAQPAVLVHRDYHSRNLMVSEPNPGVLDFQDAVYGPLSYDLASLFKDAYIHWEEDFVLDLLARYWETARALGLPVRDDFAAFHRDYEWMGVQRHLKVLGIFARLCHRDGKDGYLKDMPLVMHYLRKTCERYGELRPLLRLLEQLEPTITEVGYSF